jgi:hypothetical protein
MACRGTALLYFTLLYFTLLYFTLLILICFVDKACVQADNVIMLIHFFEERMRITYSCHANPSSRAVWGVGLDVLVAEIVGFESRLRHGYFSLYFCVMLSCVGKRLASG